MAAVESVYYNDGTEGGEDCFALIKENNGDMLDLLVFDASTGAPQHQDEVPRREKSDYDEAGGGRTWHYDK